MAPKPRPKASNKQSEISSSQAKPRPKASNKQPEISSSQTMKRSTNRTPKHDLQATKRSNVQPRNSASQPAKRRSNQSQLESKTISKSFNGNTNKRKRAQEISDDDFVAEQPKKGKVQKESTGPMEHENSDNELDTMFPPLRCRICPTVLVETIEKLSEIQKQEVREMGFGHILQFNLKDIPFKLAYWVLENFNAGSCELQLQTSRIHIEPEDVVRVYGMPNGTREIKRKAKSDYVKLNDDWRSQFGENKKNITTRDVYAKIVDDKVEGVWFKRHFMVLLTTCLIECDTTGYIRPMIMSCFEDVNTIHEWAWGSYVLDRLVQLKLKWQRTKSNLFCGPVQFLTTLFVDRTKLYNISFPRKFPTISNWTSDSMKKRQKAEIKTGAFGGGYPLAAIGIPSDYATFDEAPKINDIGKECTDTHDEVHKYVERFLAKSRDIANMMVELMEIVQEAPRNIVENHFFGTMQTAVQRLFTANTNAVPSSCSPRQTQFIESSLDFFRRPEFEAAMEEIDKAIAQRNALLEKSKDAPSFSLGMTQELGHDYEDLNRIVMDVAKSALHNLQGSTGNVGHNQTDNEIAMEPIVEASKSKSNVQKKDAENVIEKDAEKVADDQQVKKKGDKQQVKKKGDKQQVKKKGDKQQVGDKAAVEQQVGEKATDEQQVGEEVADEQQEVEKDADEQQVGDKTAVEQQVGEKATDEQQVGEEVADEQQEVEKDADEQQVGEKTVDEQQVKEKGADEQQVEEKGTAKVSYEQGCNENGTEEVAREHNKTEKVAVQCGHSAVQNNESEVRIESGGVDESEVVIADEKSKRVGTNKMVTRSKIAMKKTEALLSPFRERIIDIGERLSKGEREISLWIHRTAPENMNDIIFEHNGISLPREQMMSMAPEQFISYAVMDAWTTILNKKEQFRSRKSQCRFFATTNVCYRTVYDFPPGWDLAKRNSMFQETLNVELARFPEFKLSEIDLIFFPIIKSDHFYIICIDVRNPSIDIIDNSPIFEKYELLPLTLRDFFVDFLKQNQLENKTKELKDASFCVEDIAWADKTNKQDCGVFAMRHMETYMGSSSFNNVGIKSKSKKQMRYMRVKYCAEILKSEFNSKREANIKTAATSYKKFSEVSPKDEDAILLGSLTDLL